jgi:hypothetical protein
LLDALPIAEMTDTIMAGNHDLANRVGKATSFEVLREIIGEKALMPDFDEGLGFSTVIGQTLFCFAPHALTQTAYEAMIEDLRVEASGFQGYRVLCLHCNWNMEPEKISDSTLNLTPELACALLADFHTILLGHIHNSEDVYEGRLKLIGSVYPTAFDNMTNKRALLYDADTGVFEDKLTWDAAKNHFAGQASEAPDACQYYDLTDDLPVGESQKLVVRLFKEGAFGVRLRKPDGVEIQEGLTAEEFSRLPEVIAKDLEIEKPHLVGLWNEIQTNVTGS